MIKRSEVYRALRSDLFGPDGPSKILALRVLERVDPDSPQLLDQIISKSSPTSPSAALARNILDDKRNAVVQGFFDERKNVREQTWDNLRRNWTQDPQLLAKLLDAAESSRSDVNKMYSTAAVLKFFSREALEANRKQVETFISSVPQTTEWANTQAQISLAKKKLSKQ